MMKKLSKAATLFVLVLTFTSINILTNEKKIKILIDPQEAVYGTPFSLKVTGLNPGEKVQLTTSSVDKNGTRWESNAKFRADKSGSIDLDNQAPEYGDYTGKNVLGPFWSMKPVKTKRKELPYFCDREKGLYVKFMITNAKGENTEAQLFRYYENPKKKLNCIKLNENGLKGFLFSPDTGKKYPGVILLGGSSGGSNAWLAKAIASNGFSVLDLPYWKYPGLPEKLVNIPLEYFLKATKWLKKQKQVKERKIGLIGGSKGGELVLLLGSISDEFKAIVAWVPAAHLWLGMEFTKLMPSWLYKGKELPYLGSLLTEEELNKFYSGKITSFREYYETGLKKMDPALIKKAAIAVEKIKAPILIVSGTDDLTWPSSEYAEMIIQRLKKHNFKYDYKHIKGKNAGHMVFLPDFIPGNYRAFNGGTPKAELHWSIKSWQGTLSFLHEYLDK